MSAGEIGDRSQIAQWHGLKHIRYSPWLSPSCAQELCCFTESTSSIPHAFQLPEVKQCMAVVSSQACLACRNSRKASQELNKCLLNPSLCVLALPFSADQGCFRTRLPTRWLGYAVVFAEVNPTLSSLSPSGLCADPCSGGRLAP